MPTPRWHQPSAAQPLRGATPEWRITWLVLRPSGKD